MAPISPISLKRSTSPVELEERISKRRCTEPTINPEVQEEEKLYPGTNIDLFDEKPRQLLLRSVALILEHVGFAGTSEEAIEALCSEAETYASVFLSQITTSMLTARRPLPTPLDFDYALKQFNLSSDSLEPHLKPPVPPEHLRLQLEPPSPEAIMTLPVGRLIGDDLSGAPDKESRAYIPKHLPPFPSKHTYKWTEKDSTRETDARKIREEATQQARQGEDALRRLTTVGKIGKEKGVKLTADKDPKSKQRHLLWEEAQGPGHTHSNAAVKDVERSVVVNASSAYHRKGAAGKKKGVPQVPPELFGKK